jgi:hypothetical protein
MGYAWSLGINRLLALPKGLWGNQSFTVIRATEEAAGTEATVTVVPR